MMLKNSFLTDAYENMKRRDWVFWISFLTFLCYFPGYLVLSLNNIRSRYEGVGAVVLQEMQERMYENVEGLMGLNGVMVFIVGVMAIFIGMQGFAYLHNKRQVDFYHSQPVSRKRRFWVLWVNGIVIFVATYLVNLFLGMIVAMAYGKLTGAIFLEAFQAFFLYLLLFLGMYHLAVMSVLLTGNTLVSLLAMVVLAGYELAMRCVWVFYSSSFFLTFGGGEENFILDTCLSPIVSISKYLVFGGKEYHYSQYANQKYTYGRAALELIVLAVIFGIICFLLYKKRASESHGSSISFPKMKEILRFALLLLTGSFGAYAVYYIAGESVVLGMVGAVFVTGLDHAVIQLIYEVDFRAIRKKLPTTILSLGVVIIVFLGFKYDWTGYDSRIPKQSKVESVYLSLVAEGFGNDNYILADGTEIYHMSAEKNRMQITDLDKVYELLENREKIKMTSKEFDGTYEAIEVMFRLKNGKTQTRRLYFHYEENLGLLDEIYHMEEYQLANCQVLEDNFVENYQIISAGYSNGLVAEEDINVDMKALVEAYRKDLEKGGYTEVYYNFPVGQLTLYGIGLRNEEYRNAWNLLIYDSYENTLELLEKAGVSYKASYDENYLNKIKKIEVRCGNFDRVTQTWKEGHKTIIYQKKEQFEKILENAVPENNRWWNSNGRAMNDNISVIIYTTNPYDNSEYYNDGVYYQSGEMPKFILEDLEKVSFGEEVIIE